MSRWNDIPLVEVTRGRLVESIHYGAFSIVDSDGVLVGSGGDPDMAAFLRSSSKPLQTLPLVEMGGVEKFGMTERELAVTCASHAGTDDHVSVIAGLQKKIGVNEQQLLCGFHAPGDRATEEAMLLRGEKPTNNRNNCSGKHTGMLGQGILQQLGVEDYINPDHPVQQRIIRTFAEMCDVDVTSVLIGIDGCSAPVFAVALRQAAFAYARLCDPYKLPANRANACRKITRAMTSHPDMVAGPGRFDTVLMEVGGGKIISKGGAEGYQAIGLLEGACYPGSKPLGITIKVSDGDASGRARALTSIEILRRLGALSTDQMDKMKVFANRNITNHRGMVVGELRPCFDLS